MTLMILLMLTSGNHHWNSKLQRTLTCSSQLIYQNKTPTTNKENLIPIHIITTIISIMDLIDPRTTIQSLEESITRRIGMTIEMVGV
jgi:hypothetical protein